MNRSVRPCVKCPKRDKNGVCLIRGQVVVPNHPSCAYGRKLMNNETAKEINRKRFGWKKREPKPYNPEDEEE